ncbi:ecdysteroid-regulated 16 kDa protein [Halyomorpha halys]|uniref:ecdysteroid-regulated 16 kDa protein n=1 Tax=Halyomorpha halys TaxID=286706 RepID=UPI0006D4DBA6|nr:ecdysteroid-regulated 16 kDa protein [Halyomorpha halys]
MCSTRLLSSVIASACLLTITASTKVSKCRDSKLAQLSDNEITISSCSQPPCTLKRNTQPSISIKMKPEKDVPGVTTQASAYILGVPFPFLGVDGTSACPNMYSEDGKTKVGCPLKAGQTYQYKNEFKVLQIYPKIRVDVHWALTNNVTGKPMLCFEVPAKIA